MYFKCDAHGRELKIGESLRKILEESITHIDWNHIEIDSYWKQGVRSDHVLKAIYDESNRSVKATKGQVFELENALYIRNSYDILNKLGSSFSSSYPSESIEQEKRNKYGIFHNNLGLIESMPARDLYIDDHRLKYSYVRHQSSNIHFAVCWHEDHNNYWHWHYEILPRVLAFKLFVDQSEKKKKMSLHVVGDKLRKWQLQSLILLCGNKVDIEYHKYGVMLEKSIHINAPYPATFHSNMLNELRKNLKLYDRVEYGKVLYIPRGKTLNGRQLQNERELIQVLKNMGASVFSSGESSYLAQQKEFASSQIIVMPHGAAFGNILYCGKNTHLIELHPENYIHPEPLIACYSLEINYKMIVGEKLQRRGTEESYRVNIKEIVECIKSKQEI